MKKLLFTLALVLFAGVQLQAQTRYLDDVFTTGEVQKFTDVVYGQNYYFLNYPPAPAGTSSSNPQMADLQMDVYTPPVSDTASMRPLVILCHTGSFLPRYLNGFPVGRKDDSTIVELGYRFTRKGYVTAAINYRLGWNPFAGSQVERTRQILNAVYRAIHDAQTAVRFFKKDAATTNLYKIDPNRIILIGQGSGGFISLAYNFLNDQSETELPKFLDGLGNSVIDPGLVGYVDGIGGVYNNYNHPGYSNQIQMVGNYGGAMGDISWMNNYWPGVPVASLHCRKDIYAPIDSGNVVVPATGDVVVFVHGSRTVVKKAVQQGLNDIWVNNVFTDPFSLRAYSLNPAATCEGLFSFEIPDIPSSTNQEASPWEWWDSAATTAQAVSEGAVFALDVHQNGLEGNPNMSAAKGKAYCDTIVGFLAPRMYLVITNPTLAVENETEIDYVVYPNPVLENVTIQINDNDLLRRVTVYDVQGKIVLDKNEINASQYILYRHGLANGTYTLRLQTDHGMATKKIILH